MSVRAAVRWLRSGIRRVLRQVARVRGTRAWVVLRPVYRLLRRFLNVDRLVGRSGSRTVWAAQNRVHRVRRRLLTLGFTEAAQRELEAFATDASDPFRQRFAAWELALWHADQGGPDGARAALRWLEVAGRGEVDPVRLRRIAVVAAECHHAVADPAAAHRAIARALRFGPDRDLFLARANLATTPGERLTWINRALDHCGLATLRFDGSASEPGLDALTCTETRALSPARGEDLPLVSVLVPAYRAQATVSTALRSLLAQTWPNLEIIVVDDGSTDDTAAVVHQYQQRDHRVRLVRAGTNGGAYVARNLALSRATGEFVTCHDADDWSHPEKIERQARHLMVHRDVIGNTTQQARVSTDLRFHRRGQPGLYVFRNLSSFMFRRAPVVAELGAWDSVRFGADEELVQRVSSVFGPEAVVDLDSGPLCFQRQTPGSLTTDAHFGYHGHLMGARQEYTESYRHHHLTSSRLRYDFPQRTRPFPVPEPMLPGRRGATTRRHFDVIIASDLRLLGGSTRSSIEEVKAQRQMGLRTGLVQMSRYGVDPMRTVLPAVRDVIDGDLVQMLVYGERVSCDVLIVRYPPVLHDLQRYLPDLRPEQVRVVVNQPPMSDYGPDAVLRYDIGRCAENIRHLFGQDAVWHPTGPQVRRALHEHHAADLRHIHLSDHDWVNIIDVAAWRRPARPAPGPRVRIGRHSRDHPVKWPGTASDLLTVYPDADGYEVHILGGGNTPRQLLGYWPVHWRAWQFGELPPEHFLATLDVFVYYTHPDWVESFGRVVLEAMAAGVPAVLPHTYQELFGDGAVYAEPAEALAAVDRLMADPDYYDAQVAAAQRFVERRFGYAMHARRLRELTGEGRGPDGEAE